MLAGLQVGGVHYSLLQKVKEDVQRSGVTLSLTDYMDSVFPLFRTQIEPTLDSAQVSPGARDQQGQVQFSGVTQIANSD